MLVRRPAALCVICLLTAAPTFAVLTPPAMMYQGAFIDPQAVGGGATQNYGGMAYYAGDASNPGPRLYTSSWTRVGAIDIPTPAIPNDVDTDWSNVPTANTLIANTTIGSYYNQGLRVRDDGAGGVNLYSNAYTSTELSKVSLDLSTDVDDASATGAQGASPVPPEFSVAAGGEASMDTLYCLQPYFGSPIIRIGDAAVGPQRQVFRFGSNPTGYGWTGGAWNAIEWVQPAGTTDWQDGFVVLTESLGSGSAAPTYVFLTFWDPVELAAIGAAGGSASPATTIEPASLTRVEITDLLSPGTQGGGGVVGMTYDPDTATLYVVEKSTDPGHIVHVWSVPEPATIGLVALGASGLLALRRRRK